MPIRRRLELFEWVNRRKGRYIIEDDFNSEFRYQGRYIPTLYAEDTQDKVIYMNTFSKSLAPSLRISYMVLPPRLVALYRDNLDFIPVPSRPWNSTPWRASSKKGFSSGT